MSRGKPIAALRWGCVLPAAVVAAIVTQFIVNTVVQITGSGRLDTVSDSQITNLLRLGIYYGLPKFVFVLAGAKVAPRRQVATAVVLAIVGTCSSTMIHVVGQHLVGNSVGLINYVHLVAESAGVVCGMASIFFQDRTRRRALVRA